MRRILDLVYRVLAATAALLLVSIGTLILVQIVGRTAGFVVPSANEIAGFLMAASTFLALADTFRSNGHVRVQLLLMQLSPPRRRLLNIWCLIVGIVLIGFFCQATVVMATESYSFGEKSAGLVGIPLWIPQAAMALGLVVMTIALIDSLVELLLANKEPDGANLDLTLTE